MSSERFAAVVGSPIAHSLSPVLHEAAYAALDLRTWSYRRIEADADGLRGLVERFGPECVGLSVTMPGKQAALEVATEASQRARAVGVANTLVRREHGWFADCTDIDGVSGALGEATRFSGGLRAVLLGAGGTAAATVAAFADLGIQQVTIAVREPARAEQLAGCAESFGLDTEIVRLADAPLRDLSAAADVLVNTLPAAAADPFVEDLALAPRLLDVVYHPWPTPLARAVSAAGGRIASGLDMLLHQALGQVELFTGMPAPREQMRAALAEATEYPLGG